MALLATSGIMSTNLVFLISHLQVQIVTFIFLLILEITYFRQRKLPIFSTHCFSAMMIFAAFYMIINIASVVSLIYIDRLPLFFVETVQRLYILAIISILACVYIYVSAINEIRKRFSVKNLIISLSIYFVAVILVIIPEFRYSKGSVVFSLGPIMHLIYFIGFVYSAMSTLKTIKIIKDEKEAFFRTKRRFIIYSMIVWLATILVQFFYPQMAISTLGVTIIVFIMYLGLESPTYYQNSELGTLNEKALKVVLLDYINRKAKFFIINLNIENYQNIRLRFGDEILRQLLRDISDYIQIFYHREAFYCTENSLTMLIKNTKKIERSGTIDFILHDLNKRMSRPWKIQENQIILSSHCDFVCLPYDIPENLNSEQIIEIIKDWHLYSDGTGFYRSVNSTMIEKRKRENTILKIISDAMENDGIEMYYQPIYNIKTKKFTNVEALARLKDTQTTGYISPEEFIPIAEKNGFVIKLSNKIFEKVFSFLHSKKIFENGLERIEINLSGVQSVDANLPDLMTNLLEKYKVNPKKINLEVTESTAITSGYMLHKNMDDLKKIGCTFSMDDFGTGYSNLSQIINVDYELIKIDKSLLWPVFDKNNPNREFAKIILDNMLNMVLQLGKRIVVEGVETEEQFKYLEKKGATFIQGYYFSKPLSEEDYLKFIGLTV